MSEIIATKNISFSYTLDNSVFKAINLSVKQGEILGIVGPSGAGKSSLLKCLAGLIVPDEGSIYFENEKLKNTSDMLIPGHNEIALVTQRFELDKNFTVKENLSNKLLHLRLKDRENLCEELLDLFELKSLETKKSKYISGGEQQRLSMACALAKEPKCLLLDEPFVHLDSRLSKKIAIYLKKLIKLRGMAVVLVTHNGEEVLSWAHKIKVLRKGRFTGNYTPQNAYFQPKNLIDGKFFGELNSCYKNKKQLLFRPTEYSVVPTEKHHHKISVSFLFSQFIGLFYASYFKLENGRKIVLYATEELTQITKIYV